eukprot:CAMPEP_0197629920 /NCGR_PEP_ID=MMETSP1338-20131121/7578_1 /TAXON_ID=43686 ORGANISM="Pelagodinium beii, Strain RCC1491" /NCGR_SAMPLE_ID=MMETSP1338 /ASSEMBLY_ACC=CAM_ASM_000754 /LENGTH=419 /DNA_ID=CAMNT_0043201031 /DNA_START=155 /DNA_END=1414 /DNA_ORIENTATION=-
MTVTTSTATTMTITSTSITDTTATATETTQTVTSSTTTTVTETATTVTSTTSTSSTATTSSTTITTTTLTTVTKTSSTTSSMTITSSFTNTSTTSSTTSTTNSSTTYTTSTLSTSTTTMTVVWEHYEHRITMMGTEHYTTEAMATMEGAKDCPAWTTTPLTSSSTTTSTTLGFIGAYLYNNDVYFHICAHDMSNVLCEWQRVGDSSHKWTKFGGQTVCLPDGMCKCSAWAPGSDNFLIKVGSDNDSYVTTEFLAFRAGTKICQTTTVTATSTTTTTTIQAVGVSNMSEDGGMSKTFYFELCSVSPVTSLTCEFRKINETSWFLFPGESSCYDGGCTCPPWNTAAVFSYHAGLVTTTVTMTGTSTTNSTTMTSTTVTVTTIPVTVTETNTLQGATNDDSGAWLPKTLLALTVGCLSVLSY